MKFFLYTYLLVMVAGAPAPEDSDYKYRHASFINGTSSAFIKIIKTNDVHAQDAIYFTPAVVLIGKKNGDILRCLQEDPDECEVFYQGQNQGSVRSLLISGEYVYAGLDSGSILRCELSEGSCRTVHTCGQNVLSLTIVGGYLHAGLGDSIARCTLNEPYNCSLLHAMKNSITSLIHSGNYIYAGTSDAKLMRCSLRTENQCTLVYSMDSYPKNSSITSIVHMENRLLVLTSYYGNEYELRDCSQISDLATNDCKQAQDLDNIIDFENDMRKMAAYNGVLYVVGDEGIYTCNGADTDCSKYGHHTEVQSIAFAYSTFHMQTRYKNEHVACTWQNSCRCPPFITYYEPQQRAMFEVHVKDGKLRDYLGDLVDTSNADDGRSVPAAIFAMGPDGRILLSNVHKEGLLESSSLFAGGPVAGAGEMIVEKGVIKKMTTCSEHYRPDLVLNKQVIDSLRHQGYTDPIDMQMCCRDECRNALSNNTVHEQQENIQRIESERNISSENEVHVPLQNIQPMDIEGNIPSNSIDEPIESIPRMESEENISPSDDDDYEAVPSFKVEDLIKLKKEMRKARQEKRKGGELHHFLPSGLMKPIGEEQSNQD